MLKQNIDRIKKSGTKFFSKEFIGILESKDFDKFPEETKKMIYEDVARTIEYMDSIGPNLTKATDAYKKGLTNYDKSNEDFCELFKEAITVTTEMNNNVKKLELQKEQTEKTATDQKTIIH